MNNSFLFNLSQFKPFKSIIHLRVKYRRTIRDLVRFLKTHRLNFVAVSLGSFLAEPWQVIKAGLLSVAQWKHRFDFHRINPIHLTEEQAKGQPILLLHGDYHDHSAWISLAKSLKSRNLGPVYTVNLPNGPTTINDYKLIKEKINKIKEHFKSLNISGIKINLVGHSRGGYLAGLIAAMHLEDIGKVISIAAVSEKRDLPDNFYEIVGTKDVLDTNNSLRPNSHVKAIDAGHLGLLYSPQTHESIINWLSSQ